MLRDNFWWCETLWRGSSNSNNGLSRLNFTKTRLKDMWNKYTLNGRLKSFAPHAYKYFWLFNQACALFACRVSAEKKSIRCKISNGWKRSNFYKLCNIQKSPEGESIVERVNYSATLVHKTDKNQHDYVDVFVTSVA